MYRCEGCSYKARHYSDRLLVLLVIVLVKAMELKSRVLQARND